MADPIGLVVKRQDSLQPPLIIPADFSNMGITLRSERGVVNKGIRIGSLSQFITRYTVGLPKLGELGYYAMRELYNNAQPYGVITYPSRIVGAGATVATSTVARGNTVFASITGDAIVVKVEAGTNSDTVKITIQDDFDSPTVTEVYDNLDDTNLPESIDGISALAQVLYYGETLPDVTSGFIGAAKISATVGGGGVTALSIDYGGQGYTSPVTLVFSGGNPGSGNTNATATATVVNGVITSTTITSAGTGYTTAPTVTITPVPNVTLAPAVTPAVLTVSAGQFGDPDPGKWANPFAYAFLSVPGNPRQRAFQNYQLVNNQYVAVGSSISITKDSLIDGINDPGTGSGYTYIPGTYTSLALPAGDGTIIPLTGGTDESAAPVLADYVGTLTAKTGHFAFIDTPVSIVTSIDAYALPNHDGIEYAFNLDNFLLQYKTDAMGVANASQGDTISNIDLSSSSGGVRWRNVLKQRSKIAAYKGWAKVNNEKGGKVFIPIHPFVLGAGYIRKVFGSVSALPSIAPGGQTSVLNDIFIMDESSYVDTDLTFLTKTLGFNAVILEDGVGYYPISSRLLSTLNKNYDIHKERSINYMIDSFKKSLGFILQEANTPEVRKRLITSIDFFTQDHYNRGMFDKFKGYAGAVQIKCDSDNNTEVDVQQRKLFCQVSVRFVNIIETAFIFINNVDGSLNVSTTSTGAAQ